MNHLPEELDKELNDDELNDDELNDDELNDDELSELCSLTEKSIDQLIASYSRSLRLEIISLTLSGGAVASLLSALVIPNQPAKTIFTLIAMLNFFLSSVMHFPIMRTNLKRDNIRRSILRGMEHIRSNLVEIPTDIRSKIAETVQSKYRAELLGYDLDEEDMS